MLYYFTRVVPKKTYIDRYGRLGTELHKEIVLIQAETLEAAFNEMKPFQKGKHIKFRFKGNSDWVSDFGIESSKNLELATIIDVGKADDYID